MYVIGTVLKPQGIRGELKIKSISPYPERFQKLKKVFISKDKVESFIIESVHLTGEFVFLKLSNVNDRTSAEVLRGCELLVDESELIDLKSDEYFVHDLIGCKIYTEEDHYIGELIQIMEAGSNDVYIVRNKTGDEILIPAIADVVKQIDIQNKIIRIHLLEGLIE